MIEIKVPKPRKLDSGNWFIQVRSGGISQTFTDPDEQKCAVMAMAYKSGLIEKEKTRSHPTLTVAIDKYIEARSNTLSPSTIRGYKTIQKNRFKDAMTQKVDKHSKDGWQRICNAEAKLCSAKTLTNSWRFISSVIYEETGKRYDIRLPQIVPNEHPFLEPDQIDKFVDIIHGTGVEIPALLALSSLRRSEILALKWSNVDLEKGLIKVEGAAVFNDKQELIKKETNKNKTSRRSVPVMMNQLKTALEKAPRTSEYVANVHANTIWYQVNKICRANGLPEVGVHGLRHSFASLAYHLNIPEKIAMEIGGWANDQTMHKIYTHIAKADVEHYKTAITDYFNSEKKSELKENANDNANKNTPSQ